MRLRTTTKIVALVVVLAALVGAFAALAPPELGGSTRYVILDGSSMAPSLREGDLAVIRPQKAVEKGDVVLYHHPGLGVHVLHRVVRSSGDTFVLKGDNNDFLDDVRPTADEIEGQLWFSLPRVGSAITWARQPLHAALIVFVLAFVALGGGSALARTRRRASQRGRTPAMRIERRATHRPQNRGPAKLTLGIGLVGLALFGLLAFASLSRPSTRTETVPDAYSHVGTFSYGASVAESDVYPDGLVDTGDSVFLQLVPALDIAFDYRLEADVPSDVQGTVELAAVVSDGVGWERRVPIGESAELVGTAARATGSVDLAALADIVQEMRDLTGSGTTTFGLAIVADVEVRGRVGDEPVSQALSPEAPLLLDPVSVRPNGSGGDTKLFSTRRGETITIRTPSSMSLGGVRLSVVDARRLALIGLLVAGLISIAGAVASLYMRSGGESSRIVSLFGDRMITITCPPAIEATNVTEISDAESLYRIAEHYDRIVLHWREGRGHVFQVDEGGSAYRYRVGLEVERDSTSTSEEDEDTLILSPAMPPPRAAAG